MNHQHNRIGFVSTRFAGTDGVSLETLKWVWVLRKLGYECFGFAGESDWQEDHRYLVPEAHFDHPEIRAINDDLFNDFVRTAATSQKVQRLKDHLKQHLYQFSRTFNLNLLIVENALTIPMNIPLGLAITEFIAETNIPTVAHHHDFVWERSRYAINAAEDYLRAAFPPTLRSIRHVVINSFGGQQLALRTGASSIMLIPNVMDFDAPPPAPDGYADDLRTALGIGDQVFLLQPTRIVPRKRIEQAVNFTHLLDREAVLVITHYAGDEGTEYVNYLRDYAQSLKVRLLFAAEHFNHERRILDNGRKIYSLADAYQQADLVTYPSVVEGFGNAFLETIYYKCPIVMSIYEIFKTDIQPKGFKVVAFEDFVTRKTVEDARVVLDNRDLTRQMIDHNYELGRHHYSYQVLEKHLVALITACLGTD
ncbi:MAG: glycosyltransferase family 4 protein [Anaerolineae bacterium]|nr:glycosyltransferase family 4 protein [Anaerolineae bacterium]